MKIINTSVPAGSTATDTVGDTAVLNGTRGWRFNITNHGTTPVTNPTITVTSSLNPAQFPGSGISSFPFSLSGSVLAPWGYPGNRFNINNLQSSTVPVSASPGYIASRTVNPLQIPAGGGSQTVTVNLTPVDSRYDNADIFVNILGNVVAATNPATTQGESLDYPFTQFGPTGAQWHLFGARVGITYQFIAILQVANATGATVLSKPNVRFEMNAHSGPGNTGEPAASITISDGDLGSVTGGATYSVRETDRIWQISHDSDFVVNMSPLFVTPPLLSPLPPLSCTTGHFQTLMPASACRRLWWLTRLPPTSGGRGQPVCVTWKSLCLVSV